MGKKRGNGSHHKALLLLSQHPEYILLDPKRVLTASIEPRLFYRGSFYAEPDLVYQIWNEGGIKFLVVEFKSNGDERLKKKGNCQLEKAVDFYHRIMGFPAEGRLIIGDSYPSLRQHLPSLKLPRKPVRHKPDYKR